MAEPSRSRDEAPSELADYSVCTTWGVKGADFSLLNVFRKTLGFPELKRAVAEQNELFRPQAILIEDRASGTQLIQELVQAWMSHVQGREAGRRQDHAPAR